MTTDNIFGNDILSGDLNTSLVPELGQEDILLDITPSESGFTDPLSQELSLSESEVVVDEIDIENNSSSNNFQLVNNISVANIDPLIAANAEEFQVSAIDVNDTSFAPPQSELEFQGGFGDVDGGNDVTLEVKDNDGNVVETFKLTGEGQATLYRDEEYQYVFFSGVDETTKVDIDSTSNIKFGNYVGDSLKIETTGSIKGGDIVLSEPDETGLVLKSNLENGQNRKITGYDVIDLGTLFFGDDTLYSESYGSDINNSGQIVGYSKSWFVDRDPLDGAFFYSDGQMENLGAISDDDTLIASLKINDNGQIIGSLENVMGEYVSGLANLDNTESSEFTFLYSKNRRVYDLNNSGQIVGSYDSSYRYRPDGIKQFGFIGNGSTILDIEPLPEHQYLNPYPSRNGIYYPVITSATARSINDNGQVVGISTNSDSKSEAFLYDNGQFTNLGASSPSSYSSAVSINNPGQILISYGVGSYIYSDGQIEDLGRVIGLDLNNLGQVVGRTNNGRNEVAFIYSNGEVKQLNNLIRTDSDWNLIQATAINDNGQIVGYGYLNKEKRNRAFLLNPSEFTSPENDYISIGNISTFGDTVLLQGNEITLTGNAITTEGGEITFDGATTVDGNLTIDSSVTEDEIITGGGDITFTSTLDSASAGSSNLRLQAGTGNILFGDTVGGEAAFNNINILGADIVTATADITSDEVIRINSTGDIVTQNITSDNGRVVLSSEQKSISTLDITSGKEERDNIILEAGDSISTRNLSANELGVVRIASGQYLEEDSTVVGDVTTESITGKQIRVDSAGNFTATADALAHDGNVVVNTLLDITAENITATNGNVRLTSEEKSITTKDIFTIIPEAVTDEEETRKGNIILEAIEGVMTANLNALESGVVRITSGEIVENDTETLEDDTVVVGDVITESITGKRIDVVGTGSFTATGDITAYDGNVFVDAQSNIVAENIIANNGNIRLISKKKSVTTKDITSGSESIAGNIILEAIEGVTTANLNARELGVVRITSGEIVKNGTDTIEDDTVLAGDISTGSIIGKKVKVVGTGSFTTTGDITAYDGKIEILAIDDINTKNINSLAKSINLTSTEGVVKIEGDLSLPEATANLYGLQELEEFVLNGKTLLLDSGKNFLVSLLGQWGRNNGSEIVLQFTDPTFVKEFEQLSKDSNAVLLGRGVADIVSIIQGLAEITAGGTASGLGVAAAPASGGTSLTLTAGGALVVVHGGAVGDAASKDLGVVVGQLGENLTKQFFEASVDTRINIANGPTAYTPLSKNGEPVKAGFQHVLDKHFNKPLSSSISVFDISPEQLKTILKKKDLVISQVTAMPGGQYQRIVDTGQTVGKTALKFGGKPTSKIAVFTDAKGNLITTYPVP